MAGYGERPCFIPGTQLGPVPVAYLKCSILRKGDGGVGSGGGGGGGGGGWIYGT